MKKTTKPKKEKIVIYLGSDHAGFELKEKIKRWLEKHHDAYEDLGSHVYDPSDDYPDYALAVAKQVVKTKIPGLLLCGSGQGMCIAANKVKGVRAVVPHSVQETKLSREHNDANVLCLSGWDTPFSLSTKMIKIFLETKFSRALRHQRRINKIKKMEQSR